MFRPGRPHPRHKQSIIRYLFPRAVRDRYRERLLNFHLDTLPYLKHRLQSRVYRYILNHQRRRAEKSRILDIVARQGRRLWLGTGAQATPPAKHVKALTRSLAARRMSVAGSTTGYGPDRPSSPGDRERGYRRKRLAAMAGNLYRTGQAAVTEIKESYAQTRARNTDGSLENHGRIHIPGAFPDVAIMVEGDDQLILFPSYAKRHSKKEWGQVGAHQSQAAHGSIRDEDYWRQEWERNEDERAIIDVDVRGWAYTPHTGPMTRRNRMLVGLARQLSGIPAPRVDQGYNSGTGQPQTNYQTNEEQEKIAHEAARIERQGQAEKRVAYRGGYSERPQEGYDEMQNTYSTKPRSGAQSPDSAPTSPTMSAKAFSTNPNELTESELAVANANLMARIAPFMTNPLVALPITLFFYNDTKSQSKSVMTNDAGHFSMRAALDFVPTHVRVLASENLSTIQEIKIIEPFGVSLISDIDDTIKKSNIVAGAKEIFRNTFVRELSDLTIDGVKEWFTTMHELGVSVHYCSNSPWQLYPVLASFFKMTGLPPGSLHLKQYSGMLQGIFEPVAERKKTTLHKLLKDFPERKFLLVGDSGEADLEVYTELALANPGRILAVFIRDVTTPEETGYFDSGFTLTRKKSMPFDQNFNSTSQSSLSLGSFSERIPSPRPAMGTLIDFSEEPKETNMERSAALAQMRISNPTRSTTSPDSIPRKPPPPRPAKPAALRSSRSITELNKGVAGLGIVRETSGGTSTTPPPPPPPPRKTIPQITETPPGQSLAHAQTAGPAPGSRNGPRGTVATIPAPPLPRRRGTPLQNGDAAPTLPPRPSQMSSSNLDVDFDPLPPPRSASTFASNRSGTRSDLNTPSGSPGLGPQGVNKKVELWKRRLARAHEQLDGLGVALYTWRRGGDVIAEAEGIVKRSLADMDRKRRTR